MGKQKKWTQLWLKYETKKECGNSAFVGSFCLEGFDRERKMVKNALRELIRGIEGMLGTTPTEIAAVPDETGESAGRRQGSGKGLPEPDTADGAAGSAPVSGALRLVRRTDTGLLSGGYRLKAESGKDVPAGGGALTLEAADESGFLYGIFHILRQVAMERPLKGLDLVCNPDNPLRMLNHWDNMDGSIERGYSGQSFFFRENEVLVDERTVDYARLMASIGVNGAAVNNVNVQDAATWLITPRYLEKVAALADIFEGFGIKLFLSLDYAASAQLGNLSADPFEETVVDWWRERFAEVYQAVPGLGGFLVKADSEGRPGPFTYGRTQADGANMLAALLKPYGGLVIWRCFVYNCTQDWRDRKTDRAKAGYDNFIQTDGIYRDNVILQIKNGPMDFQIREPVSPLLGGLRKTNQILEVQLAQEYTGQQIDVCYLIPMFKEILDFRTYCVPDQDTVADIVSGRAFGNSLCGMAAVCNTGDDANWTGNDLAAANLYGFGRLSFCTSLTAREVAREWIAMTLSAKEEVLGTVERILLSSRESYEKYTSPLGIGWMVSPADHYGPDVDGFEYSRWGTYHRADHFGLGVDRADSGTGYVRQYHEPNASRYNDLSACPEELLLFFHHVPYTHRLRSGKTLIQHIYDSHFEGVEEVEQMIAAWESLRGKLAGETYGLVRERFGRQLANAREWRDQVNTYFFRKSGIPDEKGGALAEAAGRRIYD
ncbi:MAG: alpha-glucuronidase [Clostridium sp.]|jgi:alpha-glucuronidase|nr:alpha-glucuronidase [Clostridium sp.]